MRWLTRNAVDGLDRDIRKAARRGRLEELGEIRRELKILIMRVDDGFEEAVMRGGNGNGRGKDAR